MKYTAIIERGPTSYGAYIPDLPGCIAAADTKEEVVTLITAAVADHVELTAEHGETIPEPASTAVTVDVPMPGLLRQAGLDRRDYR